MPNYELLKKSNFAMEVWERKHLFRRPDLTSLFILSSTSFFRILS